MPAVLRPRVCHRASRPHDVRRLHYAGRRRECRAQTFPRDCVDGVRRRRPDARVADIPLPRRDAREHSLRISRRTGVKQERGALELLEEAVNLLRFAPLSTHVVYWTGAVPFTLALLFFLADMTHSPFAFQRLGEASFGLAVLYVWKNVWQGVFAA